MLKLVENQLKERTVKTAIPKRNRSVICSKEAAPLHVGQVKSVRF